MTAAARAAAARCRCRRSPPRARAEAGAAAQAEKFARFRGLANAAGDAGRGRELFAATCLACHQQGGQGGQIAPALDGVGPEDLAIPSLVARAGDGVVKEVVLALSATMEGQATMHYVAEALASTGVKVSQLAQGLPMGGELDWLDEGTLALALNARRPVG